jgi:hypothetical protein
MVRAMRFLRVGVLCLAAALSAAMRVDLPEASAKVSINGKTTTLAHGRAWRTGESMGVPTVSVVLAEQPLEGLDWWKGDGNFTAGQRGVALRIDPSAAAANLRGREPYRYAIAADYELQLHARGYRSWNAASLTAGLQVEEISVAGGRVRGRLEWKGSLPNPFDEAEILDGLTAAFDLPLEDPGPLPAE